MKLFPKLGGADRGDIELESEVEGLGGRRGERMGRGRVGKGTVPQISNAARLALDGHGGKGGILGSSVFEEVFRRGDTVPVSFKPVSTPSCLSPLG